MRKLTLPILICFGAQYVSAQNVIPWKIATLRASDRASVEKAACASTGKPALSIEGWRFEGRREMNARVLCEDAIENDDYRAYFHRGCEKVSGKWKCDPPVIELKFEAVNGPDEIRVDEIGRASCRERV